LVEYDDRQFREDRILFVNQAFFDVFTVSILQGSFRPEQPLAALITPEIARKYFGDADPIGRRLNIDNQFELEVTGLVEAFPEAAHFHPEFLVTWATLDAFGIFDYDTDWGSNSIYTYLLLPPGQDPGAFQAALPDFITRHAGPNWNGSELQLQPLTSIHLRSHHNNEIEPNGNIAYIGVLVAIGVFILLIASINFVNLATARSIDRAREVGVRKVVGADRRQLIRQFLAESLVLVTLSVGVGVGLVYAFLPAFRVLAERPITFDLGADALLFPILAGLVLGVGVLAGLYPAFVLSAFEPIHVLKGVFGRSGRGHALRRGLVVFQFAISIALIVGTDTILSQLRFLRSASLGFDQDQVLQLSFPDASLVRQFAAFKDALTSRRGVERVTIASERLPSELLNGSGTQFEGSPDPMLDVPLRTVAVGHDFFEALGVVPVAGRTFRRDIASDSAGVILNEAAWRLVAADAGLSPDEPEAAIGKTVLYRGVSGPLLGIVADFNMASLRETIEPVVFLFEEDW
jgi:putative ABC transport system permease protein